MIFQWSGIFDNAWLTPKSAVGFGWSYQLHKCKIIIHGLCSLILIFNYSAVRFKYNVAIWWACLWIQQRKKRIAEIFCLPAAFMHNWLKWDESPMLQCDNAWILGLLIFRCVYCPRPFVSRVWWILMEQSFPWLCCIAHRMQICLPPTNKSPLFKQGDD